MPLSCCSVDGEMMCFENADEISDDLTKIAWTKIVFHLSLWLQQIIGLLDTNKSWYFAQPRPIIVIIVISRWKTLFCYCERLLVSFSRELLIPNNVGIIKFIPTSYRLMQGNLVLKWIFQILDLKLSVSKAHVLCRIRHLEIIKLFVLFLKLIPAKVSESNCKRSRSGKLEFESQIHKTNLR